MKFLTFSQKQLTQGSDYTGLKQNHLLISIKNPGAIFEPPKTPYCKALLSFEFMDTEDIAVDNGCFTKDEARRIINFVNDHAHKADMIVCHCGAGISRSVAVASALSKILNNEDDVVFNYGCPNILVYTTILEEYFMDKEAFTKWRGIQYKRNEALKNLLSPVMFKMHELKAKNKLKEV